MRFVFLVFGCLLLFLPGPVSAHVVINEVLWAGSDLSTSDEWIELHNPDQEAADLSGWSVTSLNTKGEHVVEATLPSGTVLDADGYLVIARKDASQSRLLAPPFLVAPDLTLPNTNLLLRLRDASQNIVDTVDDGSGAPFAGANPSGSPEKASMERISPESDGTLKESWRTADTSEGFDDGSLMRGTPGFRNAESPPLVCSDDLRIAIQVQSGDLSGQGKTTLNLQAVALSGSLSSAVCQWDYGDGYRSTSCNPPSHTFDQPGSFGVRLDALNRCGQTLTDVRVVTVYPGPDTGGALAYDDGASLYFSAALPNPEGGDTGREWIALRNPTDRGVLLAGWRVRIGETSSRWIPLKGSIDSRTVLRIYDSEIKLSLPNTPMVITLVSPSGEERSSIAWAQAEEDREYYPTDLRDLRVRGRVLDVIGSTVLDLALEPDAAAVTGQESVVVKLLGVTGLPVSPEETLTERIDMLRTLVASRTVELEFDGELWDSMGRLRAYMYTDQQMSLQEQLLITGKWVVDRSADFKLKKRFVTVESPDAAAELLGDAADFSALQEEPDPPAPVPESAGAGSLYISEIFPSPDPKLKSQSGAFLGKEWLEIGSRSGLPLSLSGYMLQVGKTKKSLPSGLFVESGSRIVVVASDLHLPLPNAGSVVTLLRSDGEKMGSVTYPALKNGTAYAALGSGDAWCVTSEPTPYKSNKCFIQSKAQKEVIRSVKNPKKNSSRILSYAAQYREQLDHPADYSNLDFGRQSGLSRLLTAVTGFFAGIIIAALGVLFAFRMGYLRDSKTL